MSNPHAIPRLRVMIAAIAALMIGAFGSGPQVEEASELEIKAAMVTKFGRYVTWPDEAFTGADADFVIAVLGDDPFGSAIDRAAKGRKVGGRAIRVVRLATIVTEDEAPDRLEAIERELRSCHLLFVCRSERRRLDELIDDCERWPILTVSDLRGFARDGGMIELVLVRDSLGLHVNRAAYKKARLTVGSELLGIAKKIYDEKK